MAATSIARGARGEILRHLGTTLLQWQERDIIFPASNGLLQSDARYDDILFIKLAHHRRKVRLKFLLPHHQPGGRLILEAETNHVCTALEGKLQRCRLT